MPVRLVVVLLPGLFGAGAALVASRATAQPAGQGPETALAGQIELSRLVDVCAERLKIRIDYDAAVLKGNATLRIPDALSDAELWELTNQLLAQRGFTTVRAPGGQSVSVVKSTDAAGMARLQAAPDAAPGQPGFATLVVTARHRPVKDVVDALRPLLSKAGGTVTPLGDSRLIILSDLAARLTELQGILDRIDTPGPAAVVEEVAARNTVPSVLAAAVMQVAQKRDQLGVEKLAGEVIPSPSGTGVVLIATEQSVQHWRDLVAQFDQREGIELVTYTPQYFAAREVSKLIEQTVRSATDDRWKLVVDDLTGSLIVSATPTQHAAIRATFERLDAVPAAARRPVRTFVIRNRAVSEVRDIIEQLAEAGVLDATVEAGRAADGGAPAPSGERGAMPTVTPMPPPPATARSGVSPVARPSRGATTSTTFGSTATERALSLTIDEGTNTLIAVGEPRLLSQIEALLRTLDVRQPQVMLEVLMVTLTDNQSRDLGVELEKLRINDDLFIRLSSLFGLGTRNAAGDRTAGDASGFTGVVLSPGDFSVVVRALESLNKGRSVSMPKLLVGNNQQASLDSVVQQPYASVNASTTISTTSFGGTQDAGTVVTIKPQIAEGDHLVLEYSVSLSSFLGAASSPTLPPAKQQNRVQSVATIPDGSTVVVGGIDLESESKTTSQVPIIGDIPLVGEAFKSRNTTNNRSRFFVFIRANVLRGRGFEDLRYLSAHDMEAARVPDGWPEVEPRIIR
jgi:general secretion pathway protein D